MDFINKASDYISGLWKDPTKDSYRVAKTSVEKFCERYRRQHPDNRVSVLKERDNLLGKLRNEVERVYESKAPEEAKIKAFTEIKNIYDTPLNQIEKPHMAIAYVSKKGIQVKPLNSLAQYESYHRSRFALNLK
jgi:hypothetical protein